MQESADRMLLLVARGTAVTVAVVHPRDALPADPPSPTGAAHAVWWGFAPDGTFTGWKVNLERRVHGPASVDVHDQELDLLVAPDRTWAWKDGESFAAKTGRPGFWSAAEALAIRAEGERVVGQVERGELPFDGTWCDYRPPAGWSPP